MSKPLSLQDVPMPLGRDDPDLCVASAVVRRVSQAITHPRGTIRPRVTESMAEPMLKMEGLPLFLASPSVMSLAPLSA